MYVFGFAVVTLILGCILWALVLVLRGRYTALQRAFVVSALVTVLILYGLIWKLGNLGEVLL